MLEPKSPRMHARALFKTPPPSRGARSSASPTGSGSASACSVGGPTRWYALVLLGELPLTPKAARSPAKHACSKRRVRLPSACARLGLST
jgi:hypothetical protein